MISKKADMKEDEACKRKRLYKNLGLLALRLALALFILHGVQKLTSLDATAKFFGSVGIPAPGLMAMVVGCIELFGGIAVLLGLGTRYAGVLLTFVMLGAIATTAVSGVLSAGLPMGLLNMDLEWVYLFAAIAVALTGPGKYSIDKMYLCKNECKA
ncbi:DoxX [uncultured archaeon]|nr:DoxX [uncultured archaeon]